MALKAFSEISTNYKFHEENPNLGRDAHPKRSLSSERLSEVRTGLGARVGIWSTGTSEKEGNEKLNGFIFTILLLFVATTTIIY